MVRVFEQLPEHEDPSLAGSQRDPLVKCRWAAQEHPGRWVLLPTQYESLEMADQAAWLYSGNRDPESVWAGFRAVARKIDDKYRVLIQWKGEE